MCHQRKAGINLWLAHLPKAGTGKRQPFSPGTVASPGYLFYLPQHISHSISPMAYLPAIRDWSDPLNARESASGPVDSPPVICEHCRHELYTDYFVPVFSQLEIACSAPSFGTL